MGTNDLDGNFFCCLFSRWIGVEVFAADVPARTGARGCAPFGLVSGIHGTVDGTHRLIIAAQRSDAIVHKTNKGQTVVTK